MVVSLVKNSGRLRKPHMVWLPDSLPWRATDIQEPWMNKRSGDAKLEKQPPEVRETVEYYYFKIKTISLFTRV
jgi:hypothetical protein